jgi:hypothetical protein
VLGREEHLDRVELRPFEHRFERLIDPADAVSLRERRARVGSLSQTVSSVAPGTARSAWAC